MVDSAICSRCGCDLTLVYRARSQAGAAIDAALRAWAEGAPSSALAHAHDALALENTPFGRALRHALELACRSAKGGVDLHGPVPNPLGNGFEPAGPDTRE
jgi:hypothetical protein